MVNSTSPGTFKVNGFDHPKLPSSSWATSCTLVPTAGMISEPDQFPFVHWVASPGEIGRETGAGSRRRFGTSVEVNPCGAVPAQESGLPLVLSLRKKSVRGWKESIARHWPSK